MLDFSDLPDKSEVTLAMIEARIGPDFPPRLLFRYDWDRRLDSLDYYSHHPYLSSEACEWLVAQGVKLVGTDAPMPDDPRNGRGSDNDSPNHTILLGNGVAILEYLVNLSSIPEGDFTLSALPLPIDGGRRIAGARRGHRRRLRRPSDDRDRDLGLRLCRGHRPELRQARRAAKLSENLFTSGRLDSMALMNLLLDAEAQFGFMFTPEAFQDRRLHTIAGLGEVIRELKGAA